MTDLLVEYKWFITVLSNGNYPTFRCKESETNSLPKSLKVFVDTIDLFTT